MRQLIFFQTKSLVFFKHAQRNVKLSVKQNTFTKQNLFIGKFFEFHGILSGRSY